jgi:putative ABC transport system ATP-binding protein
MDLLERLNRELGKTLIMVTHDAKSAAHARATLHLEKGRLVEAAALAQAGAHPQEVHT